MKPDEILDVYYAGMTEVELQQRSVKSVAHDQMIQLGNRLQQVEGKEAHQMGGHNMAFQDPLNNEWIFYGKRRVTISAAIENTLRHENRQYQWLLVEAYEQFEIFLMSLYACVGARDIALWTDKERAKLPDDAADAPSFHECMVAVKTISRTKGAEFVLSSLRRIVPQLQALEKMNATGISFLLSTNLIAQMRHHIVHTRGQVNDFEGFKKKIFENCGRLSDKKFIDAHVDFINNFFRYTHHKSTICLVKVPMDNGFTHMDILGHACNLLLAHAWLAVREVNSHFGQTAK